MKTSKMALSFALIGLFIIVVGTIKYYFIQDEIFRPLVCVYVGMSAIYCAYGYNWMVQSTRNDKEKEIERKEKDRFIHERMDALYELYQGKALKKEVLEEKAEGLGIPEDWKK